MVNNSIISRACYNLSSAEPTDYDIQSINRSKTKLQFVFISLIVFGIEICYAAETAFVSPILQKIGVPIQFMSMVWGISPMIGFFICPIMGVLSDHCTLKMGRRRPFIIIYSIGIVIGLLTVGYGYSIGSSLWYTTGNQINPCIMFLTICGVALLDFNCDACQSPARAYLIDVSISEDHTTGLSTFTVMAGAGGALGYFLGGIPWNDINNDVQSSQLLFQANETEYSIDLIDEKVKVLKNQKILFSIIALVYIICVLVSISSFKEIPLKRDENIQYQTWIDNEMSEGSISFERRMSLNQQYLTKLELMRYHFFSLIDMPKYLKWLCLTHCFSWMSLLCFSLYFTDFVGEEIYEGDPVESNNLRHANYNKGVRTGSLCMALYSISCSFYSLFLRRLIERFRTKNVYIFGQCIYSFGMFILAISKSLTIAPITAVTAGIMYSSLFTIPFILLANYHSMEENNELLLDDGKVVESRRIGTDLSIISSMVFVAQIILSLFIGTLVKLLSSKTVVVYAASVFSACAAVTSRKLLYLD